VLRQPAGTFVDLLEDDFATAMGSVSLFARQLIDRLERKAAMGQSPLGVKHNVSQLGAVAVGG